MRNKFITDFEAKSFPQTKTHPAFRPGDSLRVHYKVEEGLKEDGSKKYRVQIFEGVCLRKRLGGLANSTFTVRRIGANNVGVERVFTTHSPLIDRIDLVSPGDVRRSRLYYLRELIGKAARIRVRRLPEGFVTTTVSK